MWPPRHNKQLEITPVIARKGCAVNCTVCPQELLSTTYNKFPDETRVRNLSFEEFKECIDKVPTTTRIDFSGYVEPYLNKHTSKMIKYAHDKGHTLSVYTTLVGIKESDIDLLIEICQHPTRPFSAFDQENPLCIHLPDEGGVMPISVSKAYKNKLLYFINKAKENNLGLGTHIRFMTMDTEGVLHKNLWDIFPEGKIPFKFKAISRASNLDDNKIVKKAPTMRNYEGGVGTRSGKIVCKSKSLYNNVLIPNGDVQLCCMDYGLEAKIGNLFENTYEELHTSEQFKYITDRMEDDSLEGAKDIICRRCENAGYELDEGTQMKNIEMQETLNILYEKLDSKEKVFYCRFGDGDFEIMNGKKEMMHKYSPELQRELKEAFTIQDDDYIRGVMVNEPTFNGYELVHHPPNKWNDTIALIQNIDKNFKESTFYSHVILTYMAVHEQEIFKDFLDNFIRPKKKLFIGSVDKNEIEKLVGKIDYYVEVPKRDAYYHIDEWYPKILECIDDVELVIPTAGMAGRVVQKRLWELNKSVQSIELGSIVDAAVGKHTRSWIPKVENEIKNLLEV